MDIPMDARIVTPITHPGCPMDVHHNGFHWPFPKETRLQLPMTEFSLNSSANKSTGYAPFELIYGHMPKMAITLPPTDLPGVEAFTQHALDHLQGTHDTIIKSHIDQLILANKHRQPDLP